MESPVSIKGALEIRTYCNGNIHLGLFLSSLPISNKEEQLSDL